jgi:hypothetical protein
LAVLFGADFFAGFAFLVGFFFTGG